MFLPAEWHRQAFVQITWPHKDTDWAPVLADAIDCFCNIVREIAKRETVMIAAQEPDAVVADLAQRNISIDGIKIVPCRNNDTWARDHSFITCLDNDQKRVVLNDFQFNGWGLKFAANHDNLINSTLFPIIAEQYKREGTQVIYNNLLDFVLEGGSIESDGQGTIMTTSSCLLAQNRNCRYSHQEIEDKLKQCFNAKRVLWLEHSWLDGDDTDGHIDTVARFCSPDTIAYVQCTNPDDVHYEELKAMEQELQELRTTDGKPYKLVPLPLPDACYDEEGCRLPATYANFLIINDAVLLPTYAQEQKDATAIRQLKHAFPNHEIVPIDCRVLILQHGSLHCSTMQYPSFLL